MGRGKGKGEGGGHVVKVLVSSKSSAVNVLSETPRDICVSGADVVGRQGIGGWGG